MHAGRKYIERVLLYTGGYSLLAIVVVSLYLSGLLRLTAEHWWGFAQIVGGVFVLLFPAMILAHRGIFTMIHRAVDGLDEGTATREELERGFAAVADFSRYWFVWGLGWWAIGSAAVGLGLWIRYPEIGAMPPLLLFVATVSAAFITDTYYYLTIKRVLSPIRVGLARALGDVNERAALIRPVSLRLKLLSTMTSVILVTVIFAGFLAQVRTERAVEARVLAIQEALLERIAVDGIDLDAGQRLATSLEVGELVRVDRDDLLPGLHDGHISSRRPAPDGAGVLALVLDASMLANAVGVPWSFAVLMVFSTLVAVGAAVLLARDLSEATETLRREATRVSSGDLRPGEPFDSEDEMGSLAHSFERMSSSLRAAVQGVAEAAERMRQSAGEISSASGNVAEATASTVEQVGEATSSMTSIDDRVRGIAMSTETLSSDVYEATSAVNELEAAGHELARNADVLAGNAHGAAGAVDQLATSVVQVSTNAETVGQATTESASSIEETAAAARQVESTASEMTVLAERMVGLAESGREKVQETERQMATIRESTLTAHGVIEELACSAGEIGSVVSVIDGVVAETNLLALNAAIIAAQAGEHGRAFGVVADQVKQLSDAVLVSTKEIGGLIESVQVRSEEAGRTIGRGAMLVDQGVERSADARASLEAIEGCARETGSRIDEIVVAVTEQSRAVSFAADLMGRVDEGTDQIRGALREQTHGTNALRAAANAVHEVSEQVQTTVSEHNHTTAGIGRNMESVRDAVSSINDALHEQSEACRSVVSRLQKVDDGTQTNVESVRCLDDAMQGLERMADELNEAIDRFQL